MDCPAEISALVDKLQQRKGFVRAARRLITLCKGHPVRWQFALACGLEGFLRPHIRVVVTLGQMNALEGVASRAYVDAATAATRDSLDSFLNDKLMQILRVYVMNDDLEIVRYGLEAATRLGSLLESSDTARTRFLFRGVGDACVHVFAWRVKRLSDLASLLVARMLVCCESLRLTRNLEVLPRVVIRAAVALRERSGFAGGITLLALVSGLPKQEPQEVPLCPAVMDLVHMLVQHEGHWLLTGNILDYPLMEILRRECPSCEIESFLQLLVKTVQGLGLQSAGLAFQSPVAQALVRLFRFRETRLALHVPPGYSVLHMLAEHGRKVSLEVLLTAQPSLALAATGGTRFTPLMLAVMSNRRSAVQALVQHSRLEATCVWGATALELATFNGRTGHMRVLLEAGALPHDSLRIAACRGHAPAAMLLLRQEEGPQQDALDAALEVAVRFKRRRMAWLLRRAGARGAPAPPMAADIRWRLLCQKPYLYAVIRKLSATTTDI